MFLSTLSKTPASTKKFPRGHYLVPDTNAFLNGIDLFEQCSSFRDVIILQTVLEELRNQSLPLYNRVLALTKSDEKHFCLFFNDFRLDTYVTRYEGESINDRNDRAVRQAVKWYGEHLEREVKSTRNARAAPLIVMLSDDRESLKRAKAEKIVACTLSDYVSGLEDADRLLDLINESRNDHLSKAPASREMYAGYYPMSKILTL